MSHSMNPIAASTRFRTAVRPYVRGLALAGLASLLVACGGGGSGSGGTTSTPDADPTATDGSGSIDVTIGDAPSDDYDEILLTVSEVRLLGGGGDDDAADDDAGGNGVVLGDDTVTIDLLALDAMTELLVTADEVPADQYSKIRLQIDEIVANTLDEDGNVVTSDEVIVPANGKIDLNPRGPFDLADGGALVIEIDIDANRSFQITEAGNSGRLQFRPVVFVDVLTPDDDGARITFLSGDATLLAAPEGDSAFDLCGIQPLTGDSERDLADCERVIFGDDTRIYDVDGSAIAFGAIEDASPVVVAGQFLSDEDEVVFDALLIDAGERDTFVSRTGSVLEAAVEGEFTLVGEVEDGSTDPAPELPVTLAENALIFDDEGAVLDTTALVADAEVRVMGLEQTDDTDAVTGFLATAVSVSTDDEGAEEVEGTIASVDGSTVQVTVDAAEADVCVVVGDDTSISVYTETADDAGSSPGTIDDLAVGVEVDVTGSEGADGCIAADSVVVEIEEETAG